VKLFAAVILKKLK